MILFVAVEEVEVVGGEDLVEDEVEGADEVRLEGDHRLEEVPEEPEAQLVTEFLHYIRHFNNWYQSVPICVA